MFLHYDILYEKSFIYNDCKVFVDLVINVLTSDLKHKSRLKQPQQNTCDVKTMTMIFIKTRKGGYVLYYWRLTSILIVSESLNLYCYFKLVSLGRVLNSHLPG